MDYNKILIGVCVVIALIFGIKLYNDAQQGIKDVKTFLSPIQNK